MTNAGTKTINAETNLRVKEVFLDKELNPVKNDGIFVIRYIYDKAGLTKIDFLPNNSKKFKEFSIGKDVIDRYSSFKRPDKAFMNVLRKRALELKDPIPLKKYVFECKRYINY